MVLAIRSIWAFRCKREISSKTMAHHVRDVYEQFVQDEDVKNSGAAQVLAAERDEIARARAEIEHDRQELQEMTAASQECITGLRKQNDIIKDLVKKNASVVKEKEHLNDEVQALRNELANFQAETQQGNMNVGFQINELEAKRDVL